AGEVRPAVRVALLFPLPPLIVCVVAFHLMRSGGRPPQEAAREMECCLRQGGLLNMLTVFYLKRTCRQEHSRYEGGFEANPHYLSRRAERSEVEAAGSQVASTSPFGLRST